jgi:hypothetical protein
MLYKALLRRPYHSLQTILTLAKHQVLKKTLQIAQFLRRDNSFDFKCRKSGLLFVVLVVVEAEKLKNFTWNIKKILFS